MSFDSFLDILLHPLTLAAIAGIVTFLIMKLDDKFKSSQSQDQYSAGTYFKNIVFVTLLVLAVCYLVRYFRSSPSTLKLGGGQPASTPRFDDVHYGEPSF